MKTLGNIIWFIFGGIEWCIVLFLLGCVYCVTVVGIPVGIQLFKMAGFVLWPFGKEVRFTKIGGFKIFLNVIWAIFGGLELAVCFFIVGAIFCITIIGIPFGKQYFKLGKFVFSPLGREFVKA